MRILVVGAGAIGGYFGARLAEAGRDVTFLVREGRAAALREKGLVVKSPMGDIDIARPKTVGANDLSGGYDLVLLACKAYDLPAAMGDFAPAVGAETAILPLLNGMAHLDALDARFGADKVLGGQTAIPIDLGVDGIIRHFADQQTLSFGARDAALASRVSAIKAAFDGTKINFSASGTILQEMWEKWVFLASAAAGTCLMRAPIGAIVAAPGGADFMLALLGECSAIAEGEGFAPRPEVIARFGPMLTAAKSPLTASMLRDIEKGNRIEADHVIGDLLARGKAKAPAVERPHLSTAFMALKAYEARRAMQGAAT